MSQTTFSLAQHLIAQGKIPNASKIYAVSPVSGGDINEAHRLETDAGYFFLKTNSISNQRLFSAEATSLETLNDAGVFQIPQVLDSGTFESQAYLLLEWIEGGTPNVESWELFGEKLSLLHSQKAETFGFHEDNFVGSLPQANTQHNSWPEFFVLQRLEPLVRHAFDLERLTSAHVKTFELLYGRLDDIFPSCQPSLIHGDLWSGNFIFDSKAQPCLIDPAVYYGHPEIELAFTRMFGGFHESFYKTYHSHSALEPGFESRIPIYNLYPTLVHLILFGHSYLAAIVKTLSGFR